MNRNNRLYADDASGVRTYTPTGLILQLTHIVSGSVPSATPVVRDAAARIIDDVIEAALCSGRPIGDFPEGPLTLSAETGYSLIAWIDAACTAAGADEVQEIIDGGLGRSAARINSQYLQ